MRIVDLTHNVLECLTPKGFTFVIIVGTHSVYCSIAKDGYLRQEHRAFFHDDETGICDMAQGCGLTLCGAKRIFRILKRIRTNANATTV